MATFPLSACPTLQTLTSIGEKLPDAIADAWAVEGVKCINTYGPAECSVMVTGK
jgi:hypothetical protein